MPSGVYMPLAAWEVRGERRFAGINTLPGAADTSHQIAGVLHGITVRGGLLHYFHVDVGVLSANI
jgi:hypothetical protein